MSILQIACSMGQRLQDGRGASFPGLEPGWIQGNNLGRGLVFLGAYLCAWLFLGGGAVS